MLSTSSLRWASGGPDGFVVDEAEGQRIEGGEGIEGLRHGEERDGARAEEGEQVGEEVLEGPVEADAIEGVEQIVGAGELRERGLMGVEEGDVGDGVVVEHAAELGEVAAEGVRKARALDGVAGACAVAVIGVELRGLPRELFREEDEGATEARADLKDFCRRWQGAEERREGFELAPACAVLIGLPEDAVSLGGADGELRRDEPDGGGELGGERRGVDRAGGRG